MSDPDCGAINTLIGRRSVAQDMGSGAMSVEHTFHMQHHDWRSLLRAAGLMRRAQGVSSPASHRATPFSHDGYLRLGRSRLGSSLARSVCLTKKVMSQGWYQWSFCWYHKKTKPRPAWYQNRNKTTRPGLLVLNLGFIPWSDTSRSLCSFPTDQGELQYCHAIVILYMSDLD